MNIEAYFRFAVIVLGIVTFLSFCVLVWLKPSYLVDTLEDSFKQVPDFYPFKNITYSSLRSGCWIWVARFVSIVLLIRLVVWLLGFLRNLD